jgi:hypothetical protein
MIAAIAAGPVHNQSVDAAIQLTLGRALAKLPRSGLIGLKRE